MKLSSIIAKPLIFSFSFSAFFVSVFAQDGAQAGGGGESAAESSVTSSSSKKAAVLPEVVESNPIVSIVRSGLPLTQLRKELSGPSSLSKSELRSITRSGNKNDLKNVAVALKSETAELGTISIVVKKGGSSKNSLSRAVAFKEISNIGSDSDYIQNISDALLDPTISTFGSNDDSTEEILAKVENAKKRAVVIDKILSSFDGAEDNAELSTYLTSISSVENLKNPSISISTEALDAKANAIDSVIEDFAGVTDRSKSANLLADIVNATDDEIADENYLQQINEKSTAVANVSATLESDDDLSAEEKEELEKLISGIEEGTVDTEAVSDDGDGIDSGKLVYTATLTNLGVSVTDANLAYDNKDALSAITSDSTLLAHALLLGFSVDDIKEKSENDLSYYSSAYSGAYTDQNDENLRLSKDEVLVAQQNQIPAEDLVYLTMLIKHEENVDYTVGKLVGKNLSLIAEALNLESADFSQDEALAIGGQSSFDSTNLVSINSLKNSITDHVVLGTEFGGDGSVIPTFSTLDVDPITVNEILGFTPEQISKITNFTDPGVSYALFRTLQNFSQESDIDTNLEGIGQLVSDVLVNRSSFNNISAYNADDVLNQGYIDELAYFLDSYNILGQNGSELLSFINDGNSISKENYLSGYIKYLAAYTGSRTFGDDFDTSVADIPLDNVTLLPGANFELVGNHDVSDLIDPAPLTNNNVNSDDIKILVAGAAKDFTITGDLTIHNENKVEDHALVLAAADDFYLRSEYSSANADDYSDPDTIDIEYTGSNLAIASQDTMVLVNANISTGGNLAIGTLDELHIGLSDNHHSVITLGTGGNTPSPDNLYLYANDLISANGLDIEGYVSKVYMEAHTLALRDVHFPTDSRVMLRSKIGELNFNSTPIDGYVNLYDTSHASIRDGANLVRADFEGSVGHYNSIAKHANGDPYISVRAQQAN